LYCNHSNKLFLLDCSQFKRNRRNNSHFAEKKRSWNQALTDRITLVKSSKISPTRAGSYCQRTSFRKWTVLCKMQKFQFSFSTSPLKMPACCTGRKCAEYMTSDQRVSTLLRAEARSLQCLLSFVMPCIYLQRKSIGSKNIEVWLSNKT
jgi:hypothetical protein